MWIWAWRSLGATLWAASRFRGQLQHWAMEKISWKLKTIKNHNTDLEEVVARKPIYTRSKRQGEGRDGRMNNGAGKGQRKKQERVRYKQWSGSGLYTQRRMPIVGWECLLKGAVELRLYPEALNCKSKNSVGFLWRLPPLVFLSIP